MLMQMAAEGKVESAQAVCMMEAWGVKKDTVAAVQILRKIAEEENYAGAQFRLGLYYKNGLGVAQDQEKAVEWYTKAAEQGHATAQNSLGVCYHCGQGVAQDYGKAMEWWTKAAEQGHANAQYNLGVCYDFSQGVAQDYGKAVKWYTKAAAQADEGAQLVLDRIVSPY